MAAVISRCVVALLFVVTHGEQPFSYGRLSGVTFQWLPLLTSQALINDKCKNVFVKGVRLNPITPLTSSAQPSLPVLHIPV